MNAEQKAMSQWFYSYEGVTACLATTLGAPAESHEFLKNRLKRAFQAGLSAGRHIEQENLLRKLRELLSDTAK